MSSWGLSGPGFYAPQTQEVISALVSDLQSAFGAQFGLNQSSPEGQFTAIFSAMLADCYAAMEGAYDGMIPTKASGAALVDAMSIIGAEPIPATRSVVNGVVISGTPGTAVPSNFQLAVSSNTTQIFQIAAATVIGGGGTVTASFVAVNTGPVVCPAAQLTSIVSLVAGITSATNPTAATVGQPAETDAAFRLRASAERNRPGTGTPDGLVAYLLNPSNVANVSACRALWNDTDTISTNGIPPHSVELIVTGGTDQAVANAIWAAKGGGIGTYGNTSVTVYDGNGDPHTVSFSRIVVVQVYATLTLTTNTDPTVGPVFPPDGDAQVQAALASLTFNPGQTVLPLTLASAADAVPGILTCSVQLGLAPSPSGTTPLAFASDNMAVIQAANVVVVP